MKTLLTILITMCLFSCTKQKEVSLHVLQLDGYNLVIYDEGDTAMYITRVEVEYPDSSMTMTPEEELEFETTEFLNKLDEVFTEDGYDVTFRGWF